MSNYSYCALKCEGDDYAYTSALPDISFLGGTQLTYSCDFYYREGLSGTLFSQEDAVSCDIKDGRVNWKTKNGNDLSSDPLRMPLHKGGWNHMDIVYAADLISLYINAMLVASKSLQKETTVSEKPYCFGQNYTGYLRNIRIADKALSQEEVIENSQNDPPESLLLYIPFYEMEAEDLGKYRQTVICTGLARVVSLISALTFDGSSYSYIDGLRVNPGSVDMPTFTLETRIYLQPSSTESVTLLENKANNPSELMRISLLQGQSRLRVQVGAYSYESSDVTLPYYEWLTISLIMEPTRIQIYINNTLIEKDTMQVGYTRTIPVDFYLGDSESCKGDGFIGAMEYLAFYNETREDVYTQFDDELFYPYVYTQGIQSLFLFHDEGEEDFMGAGKVLHGGTKISLLEGTCLAYHTPIFFESEGTFSGNELERWEANLVSDICLQSLAASVGLYVLPSHALPPVLLQWVADKLITKEAAQDIFCNYNNIKPNQILKLNEEILKQPHFVEIFISTLGGDMLTPLSATYMNANFEFYFLLGTSVCAAVIDWVIKKVGDKLNPNPPGPDPNPPRPKTGYTVVLKSIQFCNGETGSLPLRKAFDEAQTLPEWQEEKNDEAIIAYVAKKQTPTLKIKFQYIPAADQKSAEVSIYGKSSGEPSIFGDFSFQSIYCDIQSDYEATTTLSNFDILTNTAMGIHKEEIIWSSSSLTGITFLHSTEISVHVVKEQPIEPWSVTDAKAYPLIESLNMVNKIVSKNPPVTDLPSFVTAFHIWIRTPEKFNYNSIDKYTKITTCTSMDFDRRNLYAAMKDGLTEVGSLDLSVFLADILAMEGLPCQILGFSSYETTFFENGVEKISSLGLQINPCKILGEKQDDLEGIARHYTVGVVDQKEIDKTLVYDTLFELDTKNFEHLPMTDYLTNIALNPDLFQFSFIGYEWMEANLQPIITGPIEFIAIDKSKNEFVTSNDRPDFSGYLKNKFYFPGNKGICHRISYKTLEKILVDTFNKFKDGNITKEQKNNVLIYLCNAFYPGYPLSLPLTEIQINKLGDEIHNFITLIKYLSILCNIEKSQLNNYFTCIKDFLFHLNSSLYNLREGLLNWNSSIRELYDPEEYELVFPAFHKSFSFNNNLILSENVTNKCGIYITGTNDKNIINNIKEIEKILNNPYIFIYSANYLFNHNYFSYLPVVYSSNNNQINFVGGASKLIWHDNVFV